MHFNCKGKLPNAVSVTLIFLISTFSTSAQQNNGEYRMIIVCANRRVVVGNSSVDNKGNQLPSYARLFTLSLQVDTHMIYNATLQLIKEQENETAFCDEIAFSIRTKIPEGCFSSSRQSGSVLEIDYPLPKLKLTGQCF